LKFHQRFNIELGVEEARKFFVNRIYNTIWRGFLKEVPSIQDTQRAIATGIGIKYNPSTYLSSQIGDDFLTNLWAVEALYLALGQHNRFLLDVLVTETINQAETDLGMQWTNGKFHRTGAKILDDKLVNDVLHWIRKPGYEIVLVPYQKGLSHFLQANVKPELLSDVVTDIYEALEAFAKIVTGKDRELSKNQELFISKLKAPDEYKLLLKNYIDYANNLHRHAASPGHPKPTPSEREVESFVYLTGIFIRLAMP